jgi:tRNA (guanine-N7-)-methyltransferase
MCALRVRQHVNPLSRQHQAPIASPDWQAIFANPAQPLHLDIGCARGQFLLEMAQVQSDWNFLGIEIRDPLVEFANQLRDQQQLRNLHYIAGNINVSLSTLNLPETLQRVTIQFPDPWFKQRHRKRRVVHPQFVQELAEVLPSGGVVVLQSDVLAIAKQMEMVFRNSAAFIKQHAEDWLPESPFPIQTEREQMTLSQNKPVYRCCFQRR